MDLIDRKNKQARVYCIMNDLMRDILLNIVKNDVCVPELNHYEDLKLNL